METRGQLRVGPPTPRMSKVSCSRVFGGIHPHATQTPLPPAASLRQVPLT